MRERKYILVRDRSGNIELRFGFPIYHRDLLDRKESWRDCLGGGRWDIDSNKDIILYGSSDDFGKPNKVDLEQAIKNFNEWDHLEWISRHIYKVSNINLSKRIQIQENGATTSSYIRKS